MSHLLERSGSRCFAALSMTRLGPFFHRVVWVDPEVGVQWVIIKERSLPNSKMIVPEQ